MKSSKVERLEIQAAIAPVLRGASEGTKTRRVALVDVDGNVTGYATGADLLRGLASVHELEHAVIEDVRPKVVTCDQCGRPVQVCPIGRVRKRCPGRCLPARKATHCRAGHAYGAANVVAGVTATGRACRRCLTCLRAKRQRIKKRKRQAKRAARE